MFVYSTWLMAEELKARGFEVTELLPSLYFATNGKYSFYGESSKTPVQSSVVSYMCHHKEQTKVFMQHHGFPTAPFQVVFRDKLEEINNFSWPVVVKPLDQDGGTGVRTGVKSVEEIEQYFQDTPYSKVLVEETLEGEDTRLLVIRGKFFAAVQRQPAYVIGDGEATIDELIDRENARRQEIFDYQDKNETVVANFNLMPKDDEYDITLSRSHKTRLTVPQAGEQVFVRRNANVSTGGVSTDVTDQVSPAIRQLAEDIASAMGANTLGIDIMSTDLSKPLSEVEKAGIVEINHSPGLLLHAFPNHGEPRNPAPLLVDEVIDYLERYPEAMATRPGGTHFPTSN